MAEHLQQRVTGEQRRPQATTPTVCAIILNWNNAPCTIASLEALLPAVQQSKLCVAVCDNGSDDDSMRAVRRWVEERCRFGEANCGGRPPQNWSLVLLETGVNAGYAGGNNAAIRALADLGEFSHYWLLNSDTRVERGALDALLHCAKKRPDVGAWGCTLVHADDPSIVQAAGGCRYFAPFSIVRAAASGRARFSLSDADGARLDYVSGAAWLLPAEALASVGFLSEHFFLYFEELDFCRRLRRAGRPVAWCAKAVVQHAGGASTGGLSRYSSTESATAAYHENLSALKFTALHHPALLPSVLLFRLVAKPVAYIVTNRLRSFSPWARAIGDFARWLRKGRPLSPVKAHARPVVFYSGASRSAH